MSSQGVSTTAVYMAYNTSTGGYQTGDAANHTLRLVKDGSEAAPTNSPSEVDSTNAPGAYKLALTAAETQFGTVWIGGKSSTANVIIVPITLTFEILPTALDGNGNVKADVVDIAGSPVSTAAAQLGVNVVNIAGAGATLDGNNLLKVDVADIAGSAVSTASAQLGVNVVTIAGQAAQLDANNLLKVDTEDWKGSAVGTPATAGTPDVNMKNIAGAAVSTASAQLGVNAVTIAGQTAQLDANNLLKVDVADIGGATVNSALAQLGVNVVAIAGSGGAAATLAGGLNTVASGTVGSGASTTSIPTSAFSPSGSVSGQFIGRTLIFADTTATAALQGQATTITASTGAALPTLTVNALTTAPASGDVFYVF